MAKCKIIGCNNPIHWHWQMTIDKDNPYIFIRLGFFYSGWAVINICDEHREIIKQGYRVEFKYKGKLFIFDEGELKGG